MEEYCKELQKNGYRAFIPKGRPDAIAVRHGQVFAVEVLKSPHNNKPCIKHTKERMYEGFDGVLFKEFGPDARIRNGYNEYMRKYMRKYYAEHGDEQRMRMRKYNAKRRGVTERINKSY